MIPSSNRSVSQNGWNVNSEKYMAPTSARTLIQGKVPVNISQRRSGSHGNSIHRYGQNVNSFLKNSDGSDVIYCYMDMGGTPLQGQSTQGLIALSYDRDVIAKQKSKQPLARNRATIAQAACKQTVCF